MSAQTYMLADLARIVALPVHPCDDARNAEGLQFAKRLAAAVRADVAELIDERNRLANIVDSHEAQILRMTAEAAELAGAAGKFAALLQPEAVNAHNDRLSDAQGVYGINGVTITLGDLRRLNAALARVGGAA